MLYLAALGWGRAANAAVLLTFAVLVFVPIGYIYPSRTPQLRAPDRDARHRLGDRGRRDHLAAADAAAWLVYGSLPIPSYYVALSLYLHQQRRQRS